MDTYTCPICYKDHVTLKKYPLAVCQNCLDKYKTLNSKGHPVSFGNINSSGGFYSKDSVTGNLYFDDYVCYVNDIMCMANDFGAGNIVVSVLEK